MQSSATPVLDSKKEKKPIVFAAIMDMDGCLLNPAMSYDETGELQGFETSNAALIQHIIQTAQELKPDHYVSMSGSNRQCFMTDRANMQRKLPYLSSYTVLESVHKYLTKN